VMGGGGKVFRWLGCDGEKRSGGGEVYGAVVVREKEGKVT
jgi:hypothetical protein